MSPGHTTDRVYLALRTQIMRGDRPAGARLDPVKLAAELNSSTTPIRDALHQLLGERMIQAWQGQGFTVPVPTDTGLRNLYRWNGDLIGMLLRAWRPERTPNRSVPEDSEDCACTAGALFDAIAAALGNPEHRRAVRNTSDRLHRARQAEAEIFADLSHQHAEMTRAWASGRATELRGAIARYHRRRQKMVGQIVAQIAVAAPE